MPENSDGLLRLFFLLLLPYDWHVFNVMANHADETPLWKKRFFSGVPTPAGAILSLFPLYVWFLTPETFDGLEWGTPFVAVWAMIVAALMVSRLPTFSVKYIKIPAKMMVPAMALVALYFAALFHMPWVTLPIVCIVYMMHRSSYSSPVSQAGKNIQMREDLSSLAFRSLPRLIQPRMRMNRYDWRVCIAPSPIPHAKNCVQ